MHHLIWKRTCDIEELALSQSECKPPMSCVNPPDGLVHLVGDSKWH